MAPIDYSPLANALGSAQSVVCFVHPQATYDAVAAAVTLAAVLEQSGKSASVACEAPMRPEYRALAHLNKVRQEVGNRNLVISFPYNEEQVDKVNYNVDEQGARFELIIAPKSGAAALDPQQVVFKQSGLAADVVVLFGFHAFDELGAYYEDERYVIDSAFSLAVTQGKIGPFAKLHVALQAEQLSYSEWVYTLLRQLNLGEVKNELATNLLSGIEYATERLQNLSSARTFEHVAQLMRAGGRRQAENPALAALNMPIRDANSTVAPATAAPVWQAPQADSSQDSVMNHEPRQLKRMQQPSSGDLAQAMRS